MKRSKIEILEYISDLSAPTGPEVFAGYGTKTQNEINDAIANLRDSDILIRDWVENSDRTSLLHELIKIAKAEDLGDPFSGIKSRLLDSWEFHITDLIYQVCIPDFERLEEVIEDLRTNEVSENIAVELDKWLRDEA